LVRTGADPMAMVRQMRSAVYEIDPDTAVSDVQTLQQVRAESIASPRLTAILLGLFAALALVITGSGIAGVMALSVSQRTHEIGFGGALGPTGNIVLRWGWRRGIRLFLAGWAIGVAGALLLPRLLSILLFAVGSTAPILSLGVSFVLMGAAAIACFIPARR